MDEEALAPTGRPDGAPVAATGHPVVDEVLASLVDLDDLPVAAHVAVFAAAQERLHDTLSGPVTEPGSGQDAALSAGRATGAVAGSTARPANPAAAGWNG